MLIDIGLFATLLAIAVIDIQTRRIPDFLSLPLISAGLLMSMLTTWRGALDSAMTDSLIGASAGYLVFAIIGAAFFRVRKSEGLGLGDAKLLAGAGAWLGWQMLPATILIAALAGLMQVAVVRLFVKSTRATQDLAFGPSLSLSFFILWMMA